MKYKILQKTTVTLAVDIMSERADEETKQLQEQGYKIVCYELEAQSASEAIDKWDLQNQIKSDNAKVNTKVYKPDYESNYNVAQLVTTILSFIGWCTVIVGVIIIFVGFGSMAGRYNPNFFQVIIAMTPGFITIMTGLFSVACAQFLKATVDNADQTYQILKHLKLK
ncbi:hypothetical protein OW492_04540 [Psychromonas sp. 14N.309.X.WAT.B.A12]|uniref:hypothetical protein n=1 Tax=Psychromonas sp. 14N.309.X.WAT.B.A12 TaxID=2998322 RepID=UPI0025AF6E61|nr:hypothetical protein [Psychromonas sp. 14N.309.X.WAT.B.A12]MDN2662644.1 hypothetical protein [Psychromonas sp. 14N.309.X.WAT.B.A12]